MTRTIVLTTLVLALVLAAPSGYGAGDIDRTAVDFKTPAEIKWMRNAAGTNESAVLFGDPSKPGPYVVRVKWLPGNMSRPHFHPNDRFFVVISGTWWMGAARSSIRTAPSRCLPEAMSSITRARSITTAPRTRRPSSRYGAWDRRPPRPPKSAETEPAAAGLLAG